MYLYLFLNPLKERTVRETEIQTIQRKVRTFSDTYSEELTTMFHLITKLLVLPTPSAIIACVYVLLLPQERPGREADVQTIQRKVRKMFNCKLSFFH